MRRKPLPSIKLFLLLPAIFIFIQYNSYFPALPSIGRSSFQRDAQKPLLVIGILTKEDAADRRKAMRTTWISNMNQTKDRLPFRIVYKFLFDNVSEVALNESKIYNDIVFLNVSHRGYAVKFGAKLYMWLQYIHTNFPDALLGSKMDDDTFVCVPQMIDRLYELRHPKLYYGWRHPNSISPHMDEMFVVIGMELIKRIVNRHYCGERQCNSTNDLTEMEYADASLFQWLSIYNDIEEHADNNRIVHGWVLASTDTLINKDSCSNYLLFHKMRGEATYKLYDQTKFTENTAKSPETEIRYPQLLSNVPFASAVSGEIFSGQSVRNISIVFERKNYQYIAAKDNQRDSYNWAVVTTIFHASNAIKKIASLHNWCLLIVADIKTPPAHIYLKDISGKCVKYLSVAEQKLRYPLLSESIPFNHFGRKNIGYMYAIHHKARLIWDFDDDNVGIIDTDLFTNSSFVTICKESRTTLVNTYPYFGVNETHTWPRGFPLQHIHDKTTVPKICNYTEENRIGIIQSLANVQPDVDAIYRLTRETPFSFTATKTSHMPLVIPINSYSPFNAQATMWTSPVFDLLPLPISVHGRVSDIWRSYIALYFMHQNNYHLVFSQPYVFQERNPHTIIKDFNAEIDLYEKSKQLVDFLSSNTTRNMKTLTKLYDNLYMRKYIELDDLKFIRRWEKTLFNIRK